MTHICVGKLTIIGSDNGLSSGRRQAIIWTNAGILLIRPLGTNFSEIVVCEMTSILPRPQCDNSTHSKGQTATQCLAVTKSHDMGVNISRLAT